MELLLNLFNWKIHFLSLGLKADAVWEKAVDSCGGDINSVLVRGGVGSFQRDVLHESLRKQSRFEMSRCAAFPSVSSQQAHGAAQTGHGCCRLHRSSYFCSGMFPGIPD